MASSGARSFKASLPLQQKPLQIAIVAGESSGDRLGAGLIQALNLVHPEIKFSGIGGPKMAAVGCEILYEMDRIGVIGLDGLKEKIVDIFKLRKQLIGQWSEQPPDLFIGVDVPDFNLTVEQKLKAQGIPCVHYVSPTVWAWRGYRIHKIKRAVSHMLAMFPFEVDFYQRHNVPVTCVGHPMADEIDHLDIAAARKVLKLGAEDKTRIALLPGSRRSEVKRLAAPLAKAARQLTHAFPNVEFLLPFAKDSVRQVFYDNAGGITDLPLKVFDGQSRQVLEAADIAILASGTASLEAALLCTPHIVVYKLSAISYFLMRRLRQVDHYAMPNHLLPKPLVPELIQQEVTADNITQAALGYLNNPSRMEEIKQAFAKIHQSLKLDADKRAAEVVLSMLDKARL